MKNITLAASLFAMMASGAYAQVPTEIMVAPTASGGSTYTAAATRGSLNVGNFATPQDYGCVEDGAHDCTTAMTSAAGLTALNGQYVNEYLRAGTYLLNGAVTLNGNTLYGDGEQSSIISVTSTFNSAALGVIVTSGSSNFSGRVQDLQISFAQPNGNTSVLSGATITGTSLAATIVSGTPANGNAIMGTGVSGYTSATPTGPTILSAVSIVGSALTATVSISQNVGPEAMTTAVGRSNFTTLAAGCSVGATTGNGCQYPPAIYGTTGRGQVARVLISSAWDGINETNAGGFWLDDVEVGAFNRGLQLSAGLDFCHIHSYHFWPFGTSGGTNLEYNVLFDGATFAAYLNECDGTSIVDFTTYNARVGISSSFSWGQITNLMLDGANSTLEIAGGQWLQISNVYGTGTALGANTNSKLTVSGGHTVVTNAHISSGTIPAINITAGELSVVGGRLLPANPAYSSVTQSGGTLALRDLYFGANTGAGTWTVPIVNQTAGAMTFDGNFFNTAPVTETGLTLVDSVSSTATGNNFNNWTFTAPGALGFYANNSNNQAPSQTNTISLAGSFSVTNAVTACNVQGCTGTGSGYGTATGTMTWSGAGCTTNPVLNVTAAAGVITTVNSVTTVGVCSAIPGQTATTWTAGGGLSAGSGASFLVTPSIIQGTYTPSVGMKAVEACAVGAGGGGGGGAGELTATAASGGGGAGGGSWVCGTFTAAQIGASTHYQIGFGGAPGAPATVITTAGSAGSQGGTTFFGSASLISAPSGGGGAGGQLAAANSGGGGGGTLGGGGGSGSGSSAGVAITGGGSGGGGGAGNAPSFPNGGAGGGGGVGSGAGSNGAPALGGGTGGGSGGGLTAASATGSGGSGGAVRGTGVGYASGTAGAANTNGGIGYTPAQPCPIFVAGGGGGGGGSAATTTTAGNGGNGVNGGGGGGGGSVVNGAGSAAGWGGWGGNGAICLVEYF